MSFFITVEIEWSIDVKMSKIPTNVDVTVIPLSQLPAEPQNAYVQFEYLGYVSPPVRIKAVITGLWEHKEILMDGGYRLHIYRIPFDQNNLYRNIGNEFTKVPLCAQFHFISM